jgi:hypothetical protein
LRTAKSAQVDFPTRRHASLPPNANEFDRLHRMLAADDRAAARVHPPSQRGATPTPSGVTRSHSSHDDFPTPAVHLKALSGSSQSLESANGGAFGNWKPTSYARRIALDAVS